MSLLLTKDTLGQDPSLLNEAINVISQDAEFLRSSYPLFDQWFAQKVLPGIYTGERTLLIEKRASLAVAYMILKHTDTERKLCTLRVRPNYESKGLGVRLFQTAFELLGTERPLLSVSELAAPKFERIFKYFAFGQEAAYLGRYIPMVNELAYNGLLDHPPVCHLSVRVQHQ
ncbi:MAG: GNAT family N-acetyltransferase [Pseudomonadota bacterium]